MLGEPVAVIPEAITELRELQRLVNRVRHDATAAHGRLVEHPQPEHLVDPLLAALPLLLAQDELLDLAGRGLREIAELDRRRALEVRDVLPAELDDLRLADLLAGLQRDERLGPLAPLIVG